MFIYEFLKSMPLSFSSTWKGIDMLFGNQLFHVHMCSAVLNVTITGCVVLMWLSNWSVDTLMYRFELTYSLGLLTGWANLYMSFIYSTVEFVITTGLLVDCLFYRIFWQIASNPPIQLKSSLGCQWCLNIFQAWNWYYLLLTRWVTIDYEKMCVRQRKEAKLLLHFI